MVRLVGGTGLVPFPLCPGSGNPCAGAFWHAPTSRNLLQECMDTCRDAERASRRSTLPCAPVEACQAHVAYGQVQWQYQPTSTRRLSMKQWQVQGPIEWLANRHLLERRRQSLPPHHSGHRSGGEKAEGAPWPGRRPQQLPPGRRPAPTAQLLAGRVFWQ